MADIRANMRKLKLDLPWTQMPLIANAPMSGVAKSDLAIAVSKDGGLGQIGFLSDVFSTQQQLMKVEKALRGTIESDTLPIGIGIICLSNPVEPWLPLFQQYKPATVWLSFGTTDQFSQWVQGMRHASPLTKIWIQLGDVSSAMAAVKLCQPDALVLQGSDAGGHGHAHGASLMTLIPEVADALQLERISIPIIAAGGIMDGRSAAAAILLGASGIVMGTKYLGAKEADYDNDIRQEVFAVTDGGASTARSRVFDELWGQNFWPETYDGRCVRGAIYDNFQAGMSVDKVRAEIYRAEKSEEAALKDFACIWAGTGVGMVTRLETAGYITREVREQARMILELAGSVVK